MDASECKQSGPSSARNVQCEPSEERIAVLGAGAWGTALAHHLAVYGRNVVLWARRPAVIEQLVEQRCNRLLPGIELSESLALTNSLKVALKGATMAVLAVPCHSVRALVEQAAAWIAPDVLMVSAAKGIENQRLLLTTEIVADVLGQQWIESSVVLSGPSFAREVALGMPTSVVAAGAIWESAERVQRAFSAGRFRVYAGGDPVGVQMAGALKNVVAIAVGASDGLGLGSNARAALVTRALAEVARLIQARGGEAATVAGLAGMGDLVLTCTGELSRNRKVGYQLGRGGSLDEVLNGLGHVAEGVTTVVSARDMGVSLNVELPICVEVWRVLYEGKTPRAAVEDLLSRPLTRE